MYVWCVYVVIYIIHNMYGVCGNMRCVCTLKKLDEMASERLAHRLAQEESAKKRTTADKRGHASETEPQAAESWALVASKKKRSHTGQQPVVPMPGTPAALPKVRLEDSVSNMMDLELLQQMDAARIAKANSTTAGGELMRAAQLAAEMVQDKFMDSPGGGVQGDPDKSLLDEPENKESDGMEDEF